VTQGSGSGAGAGGREAGDPYPSDLAESRRSERTAALMVLLALGLTGVLVVLFVAGLI
jgi:hypothetical protein